jgi:hypothetical protein
MRGQQCDLFMRIPSKDGRAGATDGGGDLAFAKSVALEPQYLANLAHG